MSKEAMRGRYREQIAALLEEQRRARHPVADRRAFLHATCPSVGAVACAVWREEMLAALGLSKSPAEERLVWRFSYWWREVAGFKCRVPDVERVVAWAGNTTSRGEPAGEAWVVALPSGLYGLLVNRGPQVSPVWDRSKWHWERGSLEEMLASVPDEHFATCTMMAAPSMVAPVNAGDQMRLL